jgi:hypothetical protein
MHRERSGFGPEDVDVAHICDGFSASVIYGRFGASLASVIRRLRSVGADEGHVGVLNLARSGAA